MRKIRIFTGIFLLLISSLASAQEDLNNYLISAGQNNPALKVKFNEYLAALELVPQVKSLPDPQLAFAWFISPVETRLGPQRFRISASQFFPWFGTLKANENAAIQAAKARLELFEEAKSSLYKDIKSIYFNLYFIHRSEEITTDLIQLLKSIQSLVEVKVESGLVSTLDNYRVEMEINEMENQLALLHDQKWAMESEFRNLINSGKEDFLINYPAGLWRNDIPLTREAIKDSILTSNHQLLNIELTRAGLMYKKQAAEKAGKPGVKIGLDYILTGKGENQLAGKDAIAFPTIGISLPLYREKYNAMVREVAYLEAANENAMNDKVNFLLTLLDKAWKDYLDAQRRISLNEKQMDLSEKALRLLEAEYTTANTDLEEILRMERKLLKYRMEFEKALADKQASIAFINYLMAK